MKQQIITLSHTVIIPKDFTDFMKLSNVEFRAISYSMMQRVNELENDLLSLQQAYRLQDIDIEPSVSAPATKVDAANPGSVRSKTGAESSTLNKKIGKSSKYHFLNVQNRKGTFYCYRASTSIVGKTINMGAHKDEIQCALLADAYLDNIGDEKRTRNRDDFPEVMEAYLLKQEVQQAQEK